MRLWKLEKFNSGEWDIKKKINLALGQAEATKPFERTRRTSVLQHSWPTWS